MSYLTIKMIKGNPYLYQVRSERDGERVRQVFEKYLGRADKVDMGAVEIVPVVGEEIEEVVEKVEPMPTPEEVAPPTEIEPEEVTTPVIEEAEKEPWGMTSEEWNQSLKDKRKAAIEEWNRQGAKGFPPSTGIPITEIAPLAERAGYVMPRDADKVLSIPYHQLQVEAALAEGKPVPPEVLQDYPDLTTTPPTEIKPPIETPPIEQELTPEIETDARILEKDFDRMSHKELVEEIKTQGKPLLIDDTERLTKLADYKKGYKPELDRPVFIFKGIEEGVITDGYLLVENKEVAEDIFGKYIESEKKKQVRKDMKLNPNLTEEEARGNVDRYFGEQYGGGTFPDYKRLYPELGNEAKLIGVYAGGLEGIEVPHPAETLAYLSDGEHIMAVNADKLAFVKKHLPNSKMYFSDKNPTTSPLTFTVGDEGKGLLMPMETHGNIPPIVQEKATGIKPIKEEPTPPVKEEREPVYVDTKMANDILEDYSDLDEAREAVQEFADRDIIGYTAVGQEVTPDMLQQAIDIKAQEKPIEPEVVTPELPSEPEEERPVSPYANLKYKEGIKGINDSKLVKYEWKWEWGTKYSQYEGGEVDAKVSDWGESEKCTTCGRDIVHVYWVADKEGNVKPYGEEHVHEALGYKTPFAKSKLDKMAAELVYKENEEKALEKAALETAEKRQADTIEDANMNYAEIHRNVNLSGKPEGWLLNISALIQSPEGKYMRTASGTDFKHLLQHGWKPVKINKDFKVPEEVQNLIEPPTPTPPVTPDPEEEPTISEIPYTSELDIRNIESLPRGTGAKYLVTLKGQGDELIAKQWARVKPKSLKPDEVLVYMTPSPEDNNLEDTLE